MQSAIPDDQLQFLFCHDFATGTPASYVVYAIYSEFSNPVICSYAAKVDYASYAAFSTRLTQ